MATTKDTGKTDKNFPLDAEKSEQAVRESKDATFPVTDNGHPTAPAITSVNNVPGPSSGTADGNQAAAKLEAQDAAGGALEADAQASSDDSDFWLNVRGKTGWKKQATKLTTLEDLSREADKIVTDKDTQATVMNRFGSEVYAGVKIVKTAKAED